MTCIWSDFLMQSTENGVNTFHSDNTLLSSFLLYIIALWDVFLQGRKTGQRQAKRQKELHQKTKAKGQAERFVWG